MRLSYQKLSVNTNNKPFVDFWVKERAFGVHWHYHPEIEICYIKQGEGQRIIGDSVNQFKAHDLVLVGSNLPHTWITSDAFSKSEADIEVYVIQFKIESLVNLNCSAFVDIISLLNNAKRGITFKDSDKNKIIGLLMSINEAADSFSKVIGLYKLLQEMATINEVYYLASTHYNLESNHKAEIPISKVCNFIYKNYRNKIKISEIAELINMNDASFCRFFKRNTGKSCVRFINDLRINYATNLLLNSEAKIFEVAYDSGFNSLTHFNKTFKKSVNKTPLEYQRAYARGDYN